MRNIPRILPLVGVAIGGVLAVNALAGARDLPSLLTGAQAFAEEAGKGAKPAKGESAAKADDKAKTGEAKDAVAALLPPPSLKPKAVCAPTAAELAKEAGLSPAELQVLQSLGERRGQLDQREGQLDMQLALLAAAEAKLDAKVKALNGLKGDINSLLVQANSKEAAEIDRLVRVFEGMKAKDAAPRMTVLDDSVRLPIAAKMKERALSAVIAQMPANEAKKLTEALAKRFTDAQAAAANATKILANQTSAPPAQAAAPTPAPPKRAAAKPAPRKKAPAAQTAAAKTAPPMAPSVPPAAAPTPAVAPPAKAG
ncbi:MotE family protein [Phenylobacterium sp.]|uniref:MotE family protein n=1 Tax=Phenylobacterium sp. TaxID=1871053 RepID=UPI0039837C1B